MTITTTTSVIYNGDGNTTVFAYQFDSLSEGYVVTTIKDSSNVDVTSSYIVTNAYDLSEITISPAPPTGSKVEIKRSTSVVDDIFSFPTGTVMKPSDLEFSLKTVRDFSEESADQIDTALSVQTDAANASAAAAAASATAAASSETAAATSATNAATSATAAATSATAAATAQTNAETAETAAETAQTAAETAQTAAETAQTAAEAVEAGVASDAASAASSASNAASSATAAATSETNAATSETNAAGSATAAGTSANSAATSATNAATSATNAATSETAAATSETNAATSATAAASSATSAATSETNAGASETAAATSETNAAASATAASTSETNAATSATSAATSATNAATSETNAAASASSASTSAASASTSATNAATSETNAATSETNAATSGTAASTSATNAATSATSAATSATNAATSETNAATSETNAAASASSASTSATNAASSATAAGTSATNAATSESNAGVSETNAATSATDAANSATSAANSATTAANTLSSYVPNSAKGAANGVAPLDGNSKIASTYLPSYVDDVEEYAGTANFPSTGEAGKIYVDTNNDDIYRWSSTQYIKVNDAVTTSEQAGKLATPRDISLGGDVTGTVSFDGSQNVTLTATVVDDSHSHVIADIDNLQIELNAKQNASNALIDSDIGSTVQAHDTLLDAVDQDVSSGSNVTFGIVTVSGTVDGRDVSADGAKLDGIETGATADQSDAEIKTAYENNANTNAFTDAEKAKLSGIEASATADQTGAEIKALYEAETNAFTDAQFTKLSGIETGATADQTGAEIKTAYEGEANTNAFTDAEKAKLSGIETGATADQTGAEIKSLYEAETNAFTDAQFTKLAGIETGATADQTGAEIKTAYENNANTNAFTDAEQTKLAGIETGATADQTGAEIKTAYEGEANTNAFTDAEKTKLSDINQGVATTDSVEFGQVNLNDNAKAIFGTSGDGLEIFHDGSDSYITDSGTGQLRLRATAAMVFQNAAGTKGYATFVENGAVQLYYNGSVKFETASTGVDVTGTVTANGLTVNTATTNTGATITNTSTAASTAKAPMVTFRGTDTVSTVKDAVRISAQPEDNNYVNAGLKFETRSSDALIDAVVIKGDGKVGVGMTDPTFDIDLDAGSLGTTSGDILTALRLKTTTSNTDSLEFRKIRQGAGTDWQTAGWRLQQKVDASNMGYVQFNGGSLQGDLSFGTNDTQRIVVSDVGDVIFYEDDGTTQGLTWDASTGRLGVGATAPAQILHLEDSDVNTRLLVENTNSVSPKQASLDLKTTVREHRFISDYDGKFNIYDQTGSSSRFTISTGGNVGIGTTAPHQLLEIVDRAPVLQIRDTNTGITDNKATLRLAESGAGSSTDQYYDVSLDNGNFLIDYGPTPRLKIDRTTGGVSIGTTTILGSGGNSKLSVKSGADYAPAIAIGNDGSAASWARLDFVHDQVSGGTGIFYYDQNANFVMRNDTAGAGVSIAVKDSGGTLNSNALKVSSSGNVGIGTAGAPAVPLDVIGATRTGVDSTHYAQISGLSGALYISHKNGTSDGAVIFGGQGGAFAEKVRFAPGGSVGIGTSSPTELLDVDWNAIRLRQSQTPASATATGQQGEICWDSNYVYVCVATNTWKRSALSTW